MATVGAVKAFSKTIASLVTSTSAFDLGGAYGKIMVGIPTMASATAMFFRACDTETGTFKRIYHEPVVDSTTPTAVQIDSSVSAAYVPLNVGAQFFQIALTSATTETSYTFKVLCSTN